MAGPFHLRLRVPRWVRGAWRALGEPYKADAALAVALAVVTVLLTVLVAGPRGDAPAPIQMYVPRAAVPTRAVEEPPPANPKDPETIQPPQIPKDLPPEPDRQTGLQVLLYLMITLPLAWRRRWPLACFAVQLAGLLLYDIDFNLAGLLAMLIGAYSVAVYHKSVLVGTGAMAAAAIAIAAVKNDTWPELPGWAGVFAILAPICLFGLAIRAARSRTRASEEREEALRREQQAATSLAVARERARIARELHDVVSHHVSVMTIQAGAAGKVLDTRPDLARGALSAIESSGRETMAELRQLLGILAPGPADELLHPQPGLDQLDQLVDNVRQAGQPVSVQRSPVSLPRGLDLTAYRVVQEALTNALRHARGARTQIIIKTEKSDLVIEVTNDAPPAGVRTDPGAGTGLLGLAERLHLYDGTLTTGPRPTGGFRLHARIPQAEQPQEVG